MRVTRDSRRLPKKPKKASEKLWMYKQFNVKMLYFLLERCVTFHLNKQTNKNRFNQEWFVQSFVEIVPVVLKKFFVYYLSLMYFANISLCEKSMTFHLNKLESPSPKDDLCPGWLKFAQWFLRKRFTNDVNVYQL